MTTRRDLETHLYRAITGNRLSARTHTVDNAIKELGSRFKQPWTVAGVSRETWRRWNLPPGAKNAQKPSPAKQAGLLGALRRLRLSDSREAKMRGAQGLSVTAVDRYEGVPRTFGPSTFGWSSAEAQGFIDKVLDAYMVRGITAAVDAWLQGLPKAAGWAQEWMHPDNHGQSQSADITGINLMGAPSRAGRDRRSRRR